MNGQENCTLLEYLNTVNDELLKQTQIVEESSEYEEIAQSHIKVKKLFYDILGKICSENIIQAEKSNLLEIINILDRMEDSIKDFFWHAATTEYGCSRRIRRFNIRCDVLLQNLRKRISELELIYINEAFRNPNIENYKFVLKNIFEEEYEIYDGVKWVDGELPRYDYFSQFSKISKAVKNHMVYYSIINSNVLQAFAITESGLLIEKNRMLEVIPWKRAQNMKIESNDDGSFSIGKHNIKLYRVKEFDKKSTDIFLKILKSIIYRLGDSNIAVSVIETEEAMAQLTPGWKLIRWIMTVGVAGNAIIAITKVNIFCFICLGIASFILLPINNKKLDTGKRILAVIFIVIGYALY